MGPHFYKLFKGNNAIKFCKKKKVVKKKGEKKKRQKSALPSSDSSTFYLSSPVPTDLTIASVVSVLGFPVTFFEQHVAFLGKLPVTAKNSRDNFEGNKVSVTLSALWCP